MPKYISSDTIPDEVLDCFTPGKRYEILEEINHGPFDSFQAFVNNDSGNLIGPINVGWPCAFLDDGEWTLSIEEF